MELNFVRMQNPTFLPKNLFNVIDNELDEKLKLKDIQEYYEKRLGQVEQKREYQT